MAEAIPVDRPKQSARLAAQLNSPPLTWIWQWVALRKGMMPGSRRWTSAPSESRPRAPAGGIWRKSVMQVCAKSRVVSAGGDAAAAAGPVGVEELAARLIDAFISVGAEVVALSLQQVRGEPGGAVSIVERKRGGESGRRHSELNRPDDGVPPGALVAVKRVAEKIIEQQVGQLRILFVRFFDLA